MKCKSCKGPYHIQTGHRWSDTFVICGPCAIDWLKWLKKRMNSMDSKRKEMLSSFSDNAAKSIIGER
jgi:hypothetical protein